MRRRWWWWWWLYYYCYWMKLCFCFNSLSSSSSYSSLNDINVLNWNISLYNSRFEHHQHHLNQEYRWRKQLILWKRLHSLNEQRKNRRQEEKKKKSHKQRQTKAWKQLNKVTTLDSPMEKRRKYNPIRMLEEKKKQTAKHSKIQHSSAHSV